MILKKTGHTLFHYSEDDSKVLSDLVGNFLSAVSTFAEELGERNIQSLEFEENKFVYEALGDLLFVFLIGTDEPEDIYRIMLRDISKEFMDRYGEIVKSEVVDFDLFNEFNDYVKQVLMRYEGLSPIAKKYPTIILLSEDMSKLKDAVTSAESGDVVHRLCIISQDGYVFYSDLKSFEMDLVFESIERIKQEGKDKLPYLIIERSILDPQTSLFLYTITDMAYLLAIINSNYDIDKILESLLPLINTIRDLNKSNFIKITPEMAEVSLEDLQISVFEPVFSRIDLLRENPAKKQEFRNLFGKIGFQVVDSLTRKLSFNDLIVRTKLAPNTLAEILNYLIHFGAIRIVELYPVINEIDERFDAYLELVGMRSQDYQILKAAVPFCDGKTSLGEISLRIGVPRAQLYEILKSSGDRVKWIEK